MNNSFKTERECIDEESKTSRENELHIHHFEDIRFPNRGRVVTEQWEIHVRHETEVKGINVKETKTRTFFRWLFWGWWKTKETLNSKIFPSERENGKPTHQKIISGTNITMLNDMEKGNFNNITDKSL
jgi:hypothetical protein